MVDTSKSTSGTTNGTTGGTNSSRTRNGFGSGATFAPGISINVNKSTGGGAGVPPQMGAAANPGAGAARNSQLALPEPA
ncbi:hypothetical protein ACIG5E_39550, partial [Kitasatospora sp. NPDC053057]